METTKSSFTFKIFFQLDGQSSSNIRRFRMDSRPTYEQFVEFMYKLYGPLYHPELRLQYVDSEGDKIFVTSQIEWEEMLEEIGRDNNIIKLNVVEGVKPYYKDGPKPQLMKAYSDTIQKNSIPIKDARLQTRVTECLKQLFPGSNIVPTNIPSFLTSAVTLLNVSGCEADIDIDVRKLSDVLFREGFDLLEHKQYLKGRDMYRALLTLEPDHQTATYNLACAESLLGNDTVALEHLQAAVRLGYNNVQHLLTDPDLNFVRNHPKFYEIVKQLQDEKQTSEVEPELIPLPVVEVDEPEIELIPSPVVVEPNTEPVVVVDNALSGSEIEECSELESSLAPSVNAPSVSIQSSVSLKWASELSVLHDIGYDYDDQLLIMLLENTNGDLQKTVLQLLEY